MQMAVAALVTSIVLKSALALTCYQCNQETCGPTDVRQCRADESCVVSVSEQKRDEAPVYEIMRSCMANCVDSSINLGTIYQDIRCCGTDLCNKPAERRPSRTLECHGCLELGDDMHCRRNGTVQCEDRQDRCAEIRSRLPRGEVTLRACVSASWCQAYEAPPFAFSIENIVCCQRSLCNRAASPTHRPLRLLLPPACLLLMSGFPIAGWW